ncbi:PspC domain-containing protein [Pseudarthrobacter sp. J1738]|uniref:PspC domain-containing protein n=1 Tax=unclassified Pseudarthrobacter TaxID=2647000 RepID=UPI003D2DEA76
MNSSPNPDPVQPPPPLPPTETPTQPTAAPESDFFGWIRSLGISRGQERWVGGVASGIAQKLGIDPLIVRGLLLLLVIFAGVGLFVYGLAWALLPEPDGRIHAQEAGRGRWASGMTGALVATVVGLPALGRGFWGWGWSGGSGIFWSLLWIGLIVWFVYWLLNRRGHGGTAPHTIPPIVHRNTNYTHAPTTSTGTITAGTAPPTLAYPTTQYPSTNYPSENYSAYSYTPKPPRPPRPPRPHRPGPGKPTVLMALGGGLLVGGGLKAADATNLLDLGPHGNAIAWASAAVVLGVAILVAGFRGRTAGALFLFAIISLMIGGVFNVAQHGVRSDFGNRNWAPTSVTELSNGFDLTAGRGTIDLRSLDLRAPLSNSETVKLDITAANATILLPADIPVQIRYDITMGNVSINGQNFNRTEGQPSEDFNTDKPGAPLIINLEATVSNVIINGGQ